MRLRFIYETLKKYEGKYESWKITKIGGLGEHLKITFHEESKMYFPLY